MNPQGRQQVRRNSQRGHHQLASLKIQSAILAMEIEGVDPASGYCSKTKIYHSTLPEACLPSKEVDLFTYLFVPLKYGDRVAVIDAIKGTELSFKELEKSVRTVAAGLSQRLNVRKSDVVCFLAPNSIEFAILFLATISLGGVVTALNPLNTNGEIKKQLKATGAKLIVSVPELLGKVMDSNLPVLSIGDTNTKLNKVSEPLLQYSDLLLADPCSLPRTQLHQDDNALILFSSGTTGESKGVVITHRNIIAMCSIMTSERVDAGLNRVVLHLLPMFHVFGLMVTLANLARGSTVAMLPRFDFIAMLEAIQKYKITATPLVPPILLLMIKQDVVLKYDMSSLLSIGCGAAPLGEDLLAQCARRFPNAKLTQGYGMTESCGVGSATPGDAPEFADHFGSAGVLMPNLEAVVVDPVSQTRMAPGQQGELWMRGPSIMKEYLGNKQATAETIDKDGWLHTGDLVYFNSDGYLYIVDRLKELIKYKANQVAPAELESLLLSHPGVTDCAVIPYPDEEAGEIPMAYIVKEPKVVLTPQDVMDFVAKQVAPYKKIRKVAFIEAIPKLATGKVQRRQLVAISRARAKL